jgi:hypothetical protein
MGPYEIVSVRRLLNGFSLISLLWCLLSKTLDNIRFVRSRRNDGLDSVLREAQTENGYASYLQSGGVPFESRPVYQLT